ncbi:MAG: helix-turn-helix transcriptional regulator [Clostridia bacterium]|nr:helix-turn-helix transcriptional regulator [Clostridia bacterium]
MDFGSKLANLRKMKGLTQEELAGMLFVSRTAVSKWESGRGFPSIDSLKSISKVFSVSIDGLLSADEIVSIAEDDSRRKTTRIRGLVFGSLDVSMALLIFLPFFRMKEDDVIRAVSLVSLGGAPQYLKAAYCVAVFFTVIWGLFEFTTQNSTNKILVRVKDAVSVFSGAVTVILFILSLQPYAAVLAFVFLFIKVMMLIKRS